MSGPDFFAKLRAAAHKNESLLCVGLDPTPQSIPDIFRHPTTPTARQMLRWNQALIDETNECVCAYKPNIAFYEALGAAGHEILHETLEYIPSHIPVILDAKRGDIGNTAQAYAEAIFDHWQVDAVTLNPYLGQDSIQPFLNYANKGLFLLCHTSNPGASDFQHLEIADWRTLDREGNVPLYIHVARTAARWGDQVALVVGATYPDAVREVRAAAPHAWFLVPGIGAQGGALEATIQAGIQPDGLGLIINVGRGVSHASNMGEAARQFRADINRARAEYSTWNDSLSIVDSTNIQADEAASTVAPTPDPAAAPLLAELTVRLVELGAVKFGSFTLASGIQSPIYIDLRLLVSDPALLALVAQAYAQTIEQVQFDRFAGVPYAALPIATALALQTGKPMIYPRKEAKAYGLGKDIEGNWRAGERILMVEDLITSGGSIVKNAERLREVGLIVHDCVVLIDRAQGGEENLAAAGIRSHSVFNILDILTILADRGIISAAQDQQVRTFLAESRPK